MRHFSRSIAVLLALGLVAAACGGTDTTTTEPSGTVTTAPTVPPTDAPTTTTVPETTTSVPETTTTVPETTTTTLAGDPIDIGPAAGDVIAVVGVAFDDVLNLRAGPGTDQEILARLDPLEDEVIARGNARSLPESIWYEVEVDGVVGWASAAFLAYIGLTDDVTSRIEAQLGELPTADTMVELGRIVAESQASTDVESRIRVVEAPSVGDLGEVTYDVIGLADDALFGVRLHVFGTPDEDGVGFTLKTVEQTILCGRGVTSDGLCV